MTAFDIEDAIEALFIESSVPFTFKKVDVSKLPTALTRPGITVAATSGDYDSLGMSDNLKESIQIIILLVLKNVASEKERRRQAHPAVHYVVSKLQGQTLGLEIEPISLKNWRETTTQENLEEGLLLVEINLSTALNVTPDIEEREYRLLESIWTSYKTDETTIVESSVNLTNGDE